MGDGLGAPGVVDFFTSFLSLHFIYCISLFRYLSLLLSAFVGVDMMLFLY